MILNPTRFRNDSRSPLICHSRFSPSVILVSLPPVILDISNRGSSVFAFSFFCLRTPAADAANGKRHEMAPLQKRGYLSPAPSHGATSGRLRARLRPGPESDMGARTV